MPRVGEQRAYKVFTINECTIIDHVRQGEFFMPPYNTSKTQKQADALLLLHVHQCTSLCNCYPLGVHDSCSEIAVIEIELCLTFQQYFPSHNQHNPLLM